MNEEIENAVTAPVDRLLQEKKPASSGKGIALLALLLALAAIAASGWQWWQTNSTDDNGASQKEILARLQVKQDRLADLVESFQAQLDTAESRVDPAEVARLGQEINVAAREIDSLQGQSGEGTASIAALQGSVRSLGQRLSTVETGLTSVAAKSQNSSVELEIAEIDFLLRTANERLQLFSDPTAADLALQAADVQIEALNDPLFLSVRQRIATSRRALATVPRVDRVQLAAKLTALQAGVSKLPLRGETTAVPAAELPADAGWWESLKSTLSSLVTVRRRVVEEEPLLSLADKDYLRQGVWLQLESARLALMRSDVGVYTSSLRRVESTFEQFFNTASSAVQAELREVAAMQKVDIAPEMPDISAPWTQLRQLRDSRRLLQSAPAVETGDSGE